MFRNKQVTLKVEKSPKDPLEDLEPKMTAEEKIAVVERIGKFALLCYAAKVGIDAAGTIAVNVALKGSVATEQLGPLAIKGLSQPVVAYNVLLAAMQPALRVIEGGSPQTV